MCGDFMLGGADTFTYLLFLLKIQYDSAICSTILVEKGEIFLISGCKVIAQIAVTNKGSAVSI